MASPLTILASLIRTARNVAGDVFVREDAFAEALAFASEDATVEALAPGIPDGAEGVRKVLEIARETDSSGLLLALLEKARKATREAKGDAAGDAAQAHATTLGVTATRTHEGFDLDVAALFATAKAGNVAKAIGFTLPGAPEGNTLDVSVAQLRALAKEAKAQRWHVTARLVRDHTQVRIEARRDGQWTPEWLTSREVTIPGWSLVVEWTRASGSRGTLRFHHNHTFAGKCAAVVHVGLAENENAHAA